MRKRAALGCTVHYADPDMAALQLAATAVMLHADHTYEHQPWAPRLRDPGKRGLGATVLQGARDWPHGWRDVVLVSRSVWYSVGYYVHRS